MCTSSTLPHHQSHITLALRQLTTQTETLNISVPRLSTRRTAKSNTTRIPQHHLTIISTPQTLSTPSLSQGVRGHPAHSRVVVRLDTLAVSKDASHHIPSPFSHSPFANCGAWRSGARRPPTIGGSRCCTNPVAAGAITTGMSGAFASGVAMTAFSSSFFSSAGVVDPSAAAGASPLFEPLLEPCVDPVSGISLFISSSLLIAGDVGGLSSLSTGVPRTGLVGVPGAFAMTGSPIIRGDGATSLPRLKKPTRERLPLIGVVLAMLLIELFSTS